MDLLQLLVSIKADTSEFKQSLSEVQTSTTSAFDNLKKIATTTAVVAGVTKAIQAVAQFTGECVSSYADVEQSIGGIQKLYGNMGKTFEQYNADVSESSKITREEWQKMEDAQNLVLKNANEAYKTSGMSANTYMETATQFSASLINSLGGDTQKAAEMTDVAMQSMSDNWNTFGGDLESISNAYKGFAKQNYTMLDNLKLGYGGTKEEMERLIDDANTYAESIGQASDLSIDSFADIVSAIELIQKKQNIAGTTLREATTTISGSINTMKASWENFKAGFADPNADIGSLFKELTSTIVGGVDEDGEAFNGLIQNVLPAVERAFQNMGSLIPVVIETIGENAQGMLDAGLNLISQLGEGLKNGIPNLVENALNLVLSFSEFVRENAPNVISSGMDLIINLVQGIMDSLPSFIETVPQIITNFCSVISENMPTVLAKGVELLVTIGKGIISAIPTLIANIPQIIEAFFAYWNAIQWSQLGLNVIQFIGSGITSVFTSLPNILKGIGEYALSVFRNINWTALGQAVVRLIMQGIEFLATNIPNLLMSIGKTAVNFFTSIDWLGLGSKVVRFIANGITGLAGTAWNAISSIGNTIKDGFHNVINNAIQWGKDLISNFVQGIKNSIGKVGSAISSVASNVKKFIGFSEPEAGPLSNFHTYAPDMMQLFASGIRSNADLIEDAFNDSLGFTQNGIDVSGAYDLSNNTSSIGGGMSGGTTVGDIEIVINATDKQNSKEIADEVMYRLQHIKERNDAVFG